MQPDAIHKSLTQTNLYQYLKGKDDSALLAMVDAVAPNAIAQLGRVVQHMPLYTLHDYRHIHNVIRWMERLLGPHLAELSALEAALLLLAAHVHDLGMALSEQEYRKLTEGDSPERQKYLRFRDGFPVELQHIDRLNREGKTYLEKLLDNALLTDYLRKTHSDTGADRMRQQVGAIIAVTNESLLFYGDFDLREALELLCISHNQPVNWLRDVADSKLEGNLLVAGGERANLAYLWVILRLADIMDFDSTRTPAILFRHLGLDDEMANRFQEVSARDWKKHLAIDSWDWPERGDLVYHAPACPDPATHKSILQFIGWIQQEVDSARGELARDPSKKRELQLPRKVEAKVKPRRERGRNTYEFRDWSFRMEQDEILQLLMGVNLYGDPGLAIRELLQNSLDALELRDLRLQLKKKLGADEYRRGGTPVDGSSSKPGWFRDDAGDEHELAIDLNWGSNDKGESWIRVEDNGVGMSKDVIKDYFTRIGKSYYKSPDFHREKALLKANGLLSAPISQFGIGVLSCFMIADRLEVDTKAAGSDPVHLSVTGPGNLFWTKASARTRQGTAVTLWLKKKIGDQEVQLGHDPQDCLSRLREHYRGGLRPQDDKLLDPVYLAARHVVWPRYPVRTNQDGRQAGIRIDADFLFKTVWPLDAERFREEARACGIPAQELDSPRWARWEWQDSQTPSRIAVWHAACGQNDQIAWPGDVEGQPAAWKLASIAEEQLPHRSVMILSVGMYVQDTTLLHEVTSLDRAGGTILWIDYRGDAAPALKADRSAVIRDPRRDRTAEQHQVLERFFAAIEQHVQIPDAARNLLTLRMDRARRVRLARRSVRPCGIQSFDSGLASRVGFFQERMCDRATIPFFDLLRDRYLTDNFTLALDSRQDLNRDLERSRALAQADVGDMASHLDLGRKIVLDVDIIGEFAPTDALPASVGANWLVEAFQPSLPESWPPLNVFGAQGNIGNGLLAGPALYQLPGEASSSDGLCHRLERFAFEYDLCFPLTCIALGTLRSRCPEWASNRRLRPFFVYPFLAASAAEVYRKKAAEQAELLKVNELYALMPATRLWHTEFRNWTQEDWTDSQHISLLWDIRQGVIRAMFGCHPRATVRKHGIEYVEFLKQGSRPPNEVC
ncbi:MAG: ATP-binding protein [Bryobacterales bacterium]|nr:ATP-binding protein [Bryobacterales bacterium]